MALIVAAMVGLAFASPILYRTFCSLTGFDGTPLRAERAPGAIAGQVGVRFDANTHPGLPWRFEPEQTRVTVAPGAQTKIFYRATNLSARTITAQAAYNVSPDQVGKYFKKIQCFCFTEQTLKPGQTVDMPVLFFVDPAIEKDPDTKGIDEITLSYTFYPVETVNAAR
jgi:cytochrome c oxidase assembly protein subunit 11